MNWARSFTSAADERELPGLRREIETFLQEQGVDEGSVTNTGLLVSELTHNAVAASEGGAEVEVEVARTKDGLRIEVECDANDDLERLSRALDESGSLPPPDSERGRGLWLILSLSRNLKVTRGKRGAVRVSLLVSGGPS